ncbi:hypothetical protein [Natronospira bacteriovora]|uniref:Uncharacterized protein n=1 Tax=Natronospira bacteriovora TaxID=3069753 RepID=A0ABU0W9D6_9GAMM|nr:hypothetical protein [Natronospira sp. AB-CW4]MDQ2070647.1 hypothetical protein [Natronospira sp. AB-CW4]
MVALTRTVGNRDVSLEPTGTYSRRVLGRATKTRPGTHARISSPLFHEEPFFVSLRHSPFLRGLFDSGSNRTLPEKVYIEGKL